MTADGDGTQHPARHVLLPVLSLADLCLFPQSSLSLRVAGPRELGALDVAERTGGRLLAVGQKEALAGSLQAVGTMARLVEQRPAPGGGRDAHLEGLSRGRALSFLAGELLVAEVELLEDGDPGEEWGPAVEALARYLHGHAELRAFLDRQHRLEQPMAWVNLACQHLPITATARQRLLESAAAERCQRISRGLEALLRKEHAG